MVEYYIILKIYSRGVQYKFVDGQPLKSSDSWIIPKSRYLKSHILNCTIIVSKVKYKDTQY